MNKVYRYTIFLPTIKNKKFGYKGTDLIEITDEVYNSLKWDRINRIDYFYLDDPCIVILATDANSIESFIIGFHHATTLELSYPHNYETIGKTPNDNGTIKVENTKTSGAGPKYINMLLQDLINQNSIQESIQGN